MKENTESSYLVTIGLLLELLLTPKGIDNKPPFLSQAKIIEAIDEQRIYGQGKRTLDGRFSNANAAALPKHRKCGVFICPTPYNYTP